MRQAAHRVPILVDLKTLNFTTSPCGDVAQPCSYNYPIYPVVKHPMLNLNFSSTLRPGALRTSSVSARLARNSTTYPKALRSSFQQILFQFVRLGGADRDRTGDPLLAKQVLSQLSYSPKLEMVGLGRFELPTSPLSGVRSNQLSYRPTLRVPPACYCRPALMHTGKIFEDLRLNILDS